jgi:flagellar protein FliT
MNAMEYQNTIQLYEAVAKIMQQMLHAAKMEDWDALTELEAHCAKHVTTLKMIEDAQPLPSDALKRKVASIKSILADDREIRNLISPWMARLNSLMSANQTEQRLSQAYGQ